MFQNWPPWPVQVNTSLPSPRALPLTIIEGARLSGFGQSQPSAKRGEFFGEVDIVARHHHRAVIEMVALTGERSAQCRQRHLI